MGSSTGQTCPKHILLMVIKNISALDYTLPLFWKIRRAQPEARSSVLYCTISRRKILRESSFYSQVLRDNGVTEYDLLDFLRAPYSLLARRWRWFFSRSDWDTPRLRETGRAFGRWQRFIGRRVDYARILPTLRPDVVLFDNRSIAEYPGHESFRAYFQQQRPRVFLLPHAPHHTGTTAFTPFDLGGEPLPDYCEYWMPFKHDRTYEKLPERRDQFVCVGYPGLDSEWLAWLRSNGAAAEQAPEPDSPLRCLFIIRKFLKAGRERPEGHDAFIFDHYEFTRYMDLLRESIGGCDREIELILKPHPSNDYRMVRQALEASGIRRWRITHESIYAEVPRCELVVSLYSTTLLIPAMAGIPVMLLHSRIQDVIHEWEEMKRLYAGLHYYLAEPETLPAVMRDVVQGLAAAGPSTVADADVRHLREFFPDGALQCCMSRLGVT